MSNRIPALDKSERTFHAYVHVPFCVARCGYCDFNTYTSEELNGDLRSGFDQFLIKEIEASADVIQDSGYPARELSTVFFGGGTPSLFTAGQFGNVLTALQERFGIAADAEVTTEANPESTSAKWLSELRGHGVNRLSMGVQSFDEEVLAVLERGHSKDHVGPLVSEAKALGYEVSIDLIYGAPGESLESWKSTLLSALELGTDHISAYSLIVEPGTKLERKIRKGEVPATDEDLNAAKYELATEVMASAGLSWYEVSNWGKPSRHNSAYWASQDWWGYGPGAHSHLAGNRFWNQKHPASYQSALNEGLAVAGREELTSTQRLEEELMLGLRTISGVPRTLVRDLNIEPSRIAKAIAQGYLDLVDDRLVVSIKGRLVVDRLVLDFLS
ncbi:MAG: radical SAM family heme chaperone HemW [Aquiluna sp.]|nr:radical SAM family heme chaperone HemW [Aquiluna sp.]